MDAQLTMSHYRLLFPLNDDNEIDYYIEQITKDSFEVKDFIPNPILIKNKNNIDIVTKKVLQKLILEDMKYL